MAATVGGTVARLGTVASTNAVAADAAAAGERGPKWFVAERQTAGKGRRGRRWTSEPGNLYASHLAVRPLPPARLGLLPLAAAVALAEALDEAAGLGPRMRLKWPNDVLADGAKLAGILLEARHVGARAPAVVTGFGVNCRHHPASADDYAVTSLAALGVPPDPEAVLAALVARYAAAWDRLAAPDGAAAVRASWLARAVGVGKMVAVRLPGGEVRGRFRGLDEAGRLDLEAADGSRRAIAAGDVFLLPSGAGGGHGGTAGQGAAGARRLEE